MIEKYLARQGLRLTFLAECYLATIGLFLLFFAVWALLWIAA